MRWPSTFRLRLRSLFRSSQVERELDEELQYHLEHLVDDYVAAGLTARQARSAAHRDMGATEPRKEECRDARGFALADDIRRDVIYALRMLGKSPGFTTVAILSLALGIGANTAMFSLWHAVVRSPLPGVPEPERLVILTNPSASGSWTGRTDGPRSWLTYEEFEQQRDHVDAFSAVMASQSGLSTWQVRLDAGTWEEARGRLVSGGFFDVLRVGPAIGRLFAPADDHTAAPVAVLSHSYWQRRFGGRADVLGRTVTIRKTALTIIGVAPAGFVGETSGQQPDFWLPLRMQSGVLPGRDRLHDTPPEKAMWLHVFGRLKPGVTEARAEAQANAVFQSGLESFYGTTPSAERRRLLLDQRIEVKPGGRGASPARSEFSQSLTALLAAVGALLMIACANLANLLLARGARRQPEFALRLSLGASRGRLARQLVTESLTLAVLGSVAAIFVAYVLHAALVRMIAESDSRFHLNFALDSAVLAFVLAATVVAALLCGVLPAWRVTRTDPVVGLREQSRGASGSIGQLRSGRLLVSFQLALSLPLLVGAGLLAQTFHNLQRADLGFPAEHLLLVRVDLAEAVPEVMRRDGVIRELLGEIQRIPGVKAASFSNLGLFGGGESSATIDVEGYMPKGKDDRESALDVVGPDYFSTLGVPITLGRGLVAQDLGDAPSVCVINESFAKRFFDGRNPIGVRITPVDDDHERRASCRIAGVARDARTQDLRGAVQPRYFLPARQPLSPSNSPTFLIRAATEAGPGMAAVREAIRRVNASLPVLSSRSLEEQIAPLIAQDRNTARLAVVFGSVALALAAIGLYGLLSYGVARRTGEIAIRIALGAHAGRVTSMILRETVGLVSFGLALGGALAYAASRLIDSRLYGIAPQDPLTLSSAIALLLTVAFSAAYFPAHRASKVDPMTALR
jgi:putative ABC transport system permease protein